MKHVLIICIVTLFITHLNAQTYFFDNKEISVYVNTSNGRENRVIDKFIGNYRIVFEKGTKGETLFTILNPNQSNGVGVPFYALVETLGYEEAHGKIFKKCTYFDTSAGSKMFVLISTDYSEIVLFKNNGEIWDFY